MQSALALQKFTVHNFFGGQAIVDNASYSSTVLDMQGSDGAAIYIRLGATDIALTALKVQESDTITDSTTLASATDIPLADFSVAPLTLPSATDDNKWYGVYIPNVGNRKRYWNVLCTVGNGSLGGYVTAHALYGKIEVPNTMTERGLAQGSLVAG